MNRQWKINRISFGCISTNIDKYYWTAYLQWHKIMK